MKSLLAALLLSLPSTGQAAELVERIHRVRVGSGATLPVLAISPAGEIAASIVLFAGGAGNDVFRREGDQILLSPNFLARSARALAREGLQVLLLDAASDLPAGMTDGFRVSERHAVDVRAAVALLARPGRPVVYVGNSRGALSAASIAMREGASGTRLVLAAAVAGNETLLELDLRSIQIPVLFVHHSKDECPPSDVTFARALAARLSASTRIAFTELSGGRNAEADPCGPRTFHGFLGIESEAVSVIAAWIRR